ncbi:MAG: tetratricopeptide repeat protein [Candidatus Eremiobacterota bacterium]
MKNSSGNPSSFSSENKNGHIKECIVQYKELAGIFREKGELLKASEIYEKVIALQPEDTEILLALGRLYREMGKFDCAINAFQLILRYDLLNIQALTESGLTFQETGNIIMAILTFKQVLKINPEEAEIYEKLGELYLIMGHIEESVKSYLNAAEIYLRQELKDNVIQMCDIIINIAPENYRARRMLKDIGYNHSG